MEEYNLEADHSLLMIVDAQERLVPAMHGDLRDQCVKNIERLLVGAAELGIPTLITEQYPKGLGNTIPEVRAAAAQLKQPATTVEKIDFDATDNEQVRDFFAKHGGVNKKKTVIVAGMESHICVWQTARGLGSMGHNVHVASDACASRTNENHHIAQNLWFRAGLTVTSTETVLFDLLDRAGTPAFKVISRAVK